MAALAMRCKGTDIQYLTAEELFQEYQTIADPSGLPVTWMLANHCIKPELAKKVFELIGLSEAKLISTFAIDLADNQMNLATVEDFKAILTVMQLPPLKRLIVRFGREICVPHLQTAMCQLQIEHMFNTRVFVDLPWDTAREPATQLLARVEQQLKEQEKQSAASEKYLAKLERRKDPREQLKQMKAYRGTDDELIEECVTDAVAEIIEDSDIVHRSRYEFRDAVGGLDGMVTGKFNGADVVVFIASKHNMDSRYTKARCEIFAALSYWEQLVALDIDRCSIDDVDPNVFIDYAELQVACNKNRQVMLAFGGCEFSLATVETRFSDIELPWFYVTINESGRFSATFRQGIRQSTPKPV